MHPKYRNQIFCKRLIICYSLQTPNEWINLQECGVEDQCDGGVLSNSQERDTSNQFGVSDVKQQINTMFGCTIDL